MTRTALVIGLFGVLSTVAALLAGLWGGGELRRPDVERLVAGHAAADAVARGLEDRLAESEVETEAIRVELDAQLVELGVREQELRQLVQRLAGSESTQLGFDELAGRHARLEQQHDGLLAEHEGLLAEYEALASRWDQLLPIDSPELPGDALLLDQSVAGVVYTRALCTGSMEPTISCDDLLVLYEPASVTDLDSGDVIYFRKPAPGCDGFMPGRFTLHRIQAVVSNADGIFFRTRGDAFASADYCLVPAADVVYKLLTAVRNARVTPAAEAWSQ